MVFPLFAADLEEGGALLRRGDEDHLLFGRGRAAAGRIGARGDRAGPVAGKFFENSLRKIFKTK